MKKKIDNSAIKYKIKKGDLVEVIAGEDTGTRGEVLSVDRQRSRIVVKNANIIKRTMAKSQERQKGGIVEREASIHISNVMLVGKSGKPVRVGRKVENDKIVRYAKKSGEVLK